MTTPSIFDQLPKVTWEAHPDGWGWDYKTPEGEWGWRSSALGAVDWDNKDRREVWIAYDALMRCPDFFFYTHGYIPEKYADSIGEFKRQFQKNGRYIVGAGTQDECVSFTSGVKDFANNHPEFFQSYLEGVERIRDPEAFMMHQVYEGDTRK